jgi:hypothetical protein
VTLLIMDVSAAVVAKVPGGNLRVSRADFGALWAAAEDWGGRPGPDNDYLIGVLRTCRWLGAQPVWSSVVGRAEMPTAPYTGRRHSAMPETIDAEYLAAAAGQVSRPNRPVSRPELARGVVAALDWTWHGSRRPPFEIPRSAVG